MNLWGSQYASGIKELLKGLDDANLKDLAKTACSNHFTGASSKGECVPSTSVGETMHLSK